MSYADQFELSRQLRPDEGYHFSKSECGFFLPEMEAIIEKYEAEIADPAISDTLRRMCVHHLAGLRYIHKGMYDGFHGKGSFDMLDKPST